MKDLSQELSLATETESDLEILEDRQAQHHKYVAVLRQILPYLGQDPEKIVFAQVMLALKLDGIIGKELSAEDSEMVNSIRSAILSSAHRREDAMLMANRIMSSDD